MSFVPVVMVSGVPVCPSCKAMGDFDANEKGVILFYRLNSLLDHAYDQGVIPHVIAISKLLELDRSAFFLPGVDVTFHDKSTTEFDLLGIYKGKFTVGEVKTSPGELNQRNFADYLKKAIHIEADAFIVATMYPLEATFLNFAIQKTLNQGLDLIVVQRQIDGISVDEHRVNWKSVLVNSSK